MPADPAGGEGGTQARLTLIHLQRVEVRTAQPRGRDRHLRAGPGPLVPRQGFGERRQRRGRSSAVDVQPAAGERCIACFGLTAPAHLRAGGSAQQPFSGRITPGTGEALALADGTPHLGTARSS